MALLMASVVRKMVENERIRRRSLGSLRLLAAVVLLSVGSRQLLVLIGQNKTSTSSLISLVSAENDVFGEESNDSPTSEALDDDDDDDDEELDASATNEYPDGDSNDESYSDTEDYPAQQESGQINRWLSAASTTSLPNSVRTPMPSASAPAKSVAARLGGHSIWQDLDGWRRNKRDIEDRLVLASRRAAARERSRQAAQTDDFSDAVDDGDEDAWVHDGVDDIHIDPETKRAASELSNDEPQKSIDAEYEPKEQQTSNDSPVINRTRVTTIAEVIPMLDADDSSGGGDGDDQQQQPTAASAQQLQEGALVPASRLTLAQVQRLMGGQHSERPLAAASLAQRSTGGATASNNNNNNNDDWD